MRKTLLPILLLFLLMKSLFATANTTQIANASPMRFYMMNYSYANMQSFLPIVSFGLATDLNQIAYKNGSGVLYKLLCDASGAALTPAQRIFFADASGRAASNENLLFDGTTLKTSKVASLRDSTYDLIAMDSVKANTGTFTGAVAGATLNTGNGDNELYPMNQDVRTTASPTFNKVTSIRDSTFDLIATDSIKGHTGTFTSTVLADTLKVTKGISSSGRVTATDLDVSDSVKAATGTFTGRVVAKSVGVLYSTDSVSALKGHFVESATVGTATAQYFAATGSIISQTYDIGSAAPSFYVRKINNGDMEIGNGDRTMDPESKIFIDSTVADSAVWISHDTTKLKKLNILGSNCFDTGSFLLTFNDSAATQVRAKYIKIFNAVTITIPYSHCIGNGNWINNMRYVNSDDLHATGVPASIRPLTATDGCNNVYTGAVIGATFWSEYGGVEEVHGSVIVTIFSDGKILFEDAAYSGLPPGYRGFRVNTQNYNPISTAIPIYYVMDR